MTIGNRIKELRKHIKFNQKQFAESLMIEQGYLSQIENGKREPSQRLVKDIINTFGVNDDWLNGTSDTMFSKHVDIKSIKKDLDRNFTSTGQLSDWIPKGDAPYIPLDAELLTDILNGIDNFLDIHNKTLENKYKAQLAVTLYEHFSAEYENEIKSGKIISFNDFKTKQDINKSITLMMLGAGNG